MGHSFFPSCWHLLHCSVKALPHFKKRLQAEVFQTLLVNGRLLFAQATSAEIRRPTPKGIKTCGFGGSMAVAPQHVLDRWGPE